MQMIRIKIQTSISEPFKFELDPPTLPPPASAHRPRFSKSTRTRESLSAAAKSFYARSSGGTGVGVASTPFKTAVFIPTPRSLSPPIPLSFLLRSRTHGRIYTASSSCGGGRRLFTGTGPTTAAPTIIRSMNINFCVNSSPFIVYGFRWAGCRGEVRAYIRVGCCTTDDDDDGQQPLRGGHVKNAIARPLSRRPEGFSHLNKTIPPPSRRRSPSVTCNNNNNMYLYNTRVFALQQQQSCLSPSRAFPPPLPPPPPQLYSNILDRGPANVCFSYEQRLTPPPPHTPPPSAANPRRVISRRT